MEIGVKMPYTQVFMSSWSPGYLSIYISATFRRPLYEQVTNTQKVRVSQSKYGHLKKGYNAKARKSPFNTSGKKDLVIAQGMQMQYAVFLRKMRRMNCSCDRFVTN